jgi:molybdopterin adenylyltransferase
MNDAEISSISSQPLKIGLISISDRASQGVYQDLGLPALKEWFARALVSPFTVCEKLIADDRATITANIIDLVDNQKCDLVITTGGTGPSRRDVTPEATLAAATREMPGFGEQMRQISLKFVPTAILSRQTAVLRETDDHAALVMNLPGQPKAIAQTLEGLRSETGEVMTPGIFAAVPYCIDLMGGPFIETDPLVVKVFRPKAAKAT